MPPGCLRRCCCRPTAASRLGPAAAAATAAMAECRLLRAFEGADDLDASPPLPPPAAVAAAPLLPPPPASAAAAPLLSGAASTAAAVADVLESARRPPLRLRWRPSCGRASAPCWALPQQLCSPPLPAPAQLKTEYYLLGCPHVRQHSCPTHIAACSTRMA